MHKASPVKQGPRSLLFKMASKNILNTSSLRIKTSAKASDRVSVLLPLLKNSQSLKKINKNGVSSVLDANTACHICFLTLPSLETRLLRYHCFPLLCWLLPLCRGSFRCLNTLFQECFCGRRKRPRV